MKLYGEMDKPGRDILYHDTDIVIYISQADNDPALGNFLGEFSNELNGDVITTFVAGKSHFQDRSKLLYSIFF